MRAWAMMVALALTACAGEDGEGAGADEGVTREVVECDAPDGDVGIAGDAIFQASGLDVGGPRPAFIWVYNADGSARQVTELNVQPDGRVWIPCFEDGQTVELVVP